MHTIQTTSDDVLEQTVSLFGMNLRLSVGSPSLIEFNLPFVLVLIDKSGRGVNSISKDDFNNRMQIVIMSKDEWRASIRQRSQTQNR